MDLRQGKQVSIEFLFLNLNVVFMSSEVFYSRLNLKHCIILLHSLS